MQSDAFRNTKCIILNYFYQLKVLKRREEIRAPEGGVEGANK